MSPIWTRIVNGVAKDPSSFMGSPSSSCRLQVTSSTQPPPRFMCFLRHHHPHSRCVCHSSQDGTRVGARTSIKLLAWPEYDSPSPSAAILHGQRFTCRYDISCSTSASMDGDKPFLREFSMGSEVSTQAQQPYSSHKNEAHFLSQENPHTPPNLLTPNILSARRTTGSLQWSDSPLWDIVVHPFFFPFLLTPTDINNSSMGSNGY